MQKFTILTFTSRLIVASYIAFCFCGLQGYLPVSMHTNWNINVSFVVHVNFDHVWGWNAIPYNLKMSLCSEKRAKCE